MGYDNSTLKFEIIEHIETLSSYKRTVREFNIVKWNNRDPKYDIRSWDLKHKHPEKGICVTKEQLSEIIDAISDNAKYIDTSDIEGTAVGSGKYKCSLLRNCRILSKDKKGWTIEVNIVRWGKYPPGFDVRRWGPNRVIAGKGFNIHKNEIAVLLKSYSKYIKGDPIKPPVASPTQLPSKEDIDTATIANDLFI